MLAKQGPTTAAIAVRLAVLLALAGCVFGSSRAWAGEQRSSGAEGVSGVWTARIPDAFPRDVFTWRLHEDGTYEEDGADLETGQAIQQRLTGRWSLDGDHMTLRQDTIGYVFEGTLAGKRYLGTLFLGGRVVSAFCAAKGDDAPRRCDDGQSALLTLPGG